MVPSHRPGSHRTAEPTEELRYVKPFPDTACVNAQGCRKPNITHRMCANTADYADCSAVFMV